MTPEEIRKRISTLNSEIKLLRSLLPKYPKIEYGKVAIHVKWDHNDEWRMLKTIFKEGYYSSKTRRYQDMLESIGYTVAYSTHYKPQPRQVTRYPVDKYLLLGFGKKGHYLLNYKTIPRSAIVKFLSEYKGEYPKKLFLIEPSNRDSLTVEEDVSYYLVQGKDFDGFQYDKSYESFSHEGLRMVFRKSQYPHRALGWIESKEGIRESLKDDSRKVYEWLTRLGDAIFIKEGVKLKTKVSDMGFIRPLREEHKLSTVTRNKLLSLISEMDVSKLLRTKFKKDKGLGAKTLDAISYIQTEIDKHLERRKQWISAPRTSSPLNPPS